MHMKKINITMIVLALFCLVASAIVIVDKSYSYGLTTNISGSRGSRVINYYDAGTDSKITFQDAYNYYGVKKYDYYIENNETVYFYQGKEISQNEYTNGHAAEEADERASLYGRNAYRVHNTEEFKKAIDDIFYNLKIGEFHIEFSPYENINFTEIKNYYDTNYGVSNIRENYYPYKVKGPQEPDRFGFDINNVKMNGELILDTKSIRITGNERKILEDFTNKLLPYLKVNGTDYEKIYAAYTYIKNTTTYEVDNGFINDLLASNTSAYDALINHRTTCIGYSIAFSYLMDKLGVESYIVDNITEADATTHTFNSVHTWNIVKLNNVFYKVDLTGSAFLTTVSPNELYNSALPLATSKYSSSQTVNIDYQAINRLLNESKSIKTTTTKRVNPTTTTKTYPYEMPNQGNKTTNKNANQQGATTTEPTTEKIITTTDDEGNSWIVTTDEVGNTYTVTTNSTEENKATSKTDKEESKKFNLNFILFPLLFIIVAFLIVYKLKMKKVNINSSEVQNVLNQDIQNNEENNNINNIK